MKKRSFLTACVVVFASACQPKASSSQNNTPPEVPAEPPKSGCCETVKPKAALEVQTVAVPEVKGEVQAVAAPEVKAKAAPETQTVSTPEVKVEKSQ